MPPGHLPTKETSKQRALRIELLYLRRGHAWYRSKYAWSLVALLIAAAYVVWLGVGGEPAAAQLSPGPLASPHAALNTRCADCHTEYVSTSVGGGGVNWLSSKLLGADVEVRDGKEFHTHAGDVKCIVCHQKEAAAHHQNQRLEDLQNCASCHADHQGHNASLVRPDDSACTRCHIGIGPHRRDGKSEYQPPIEDVAFFGKVGEPKPSHPKFRSLANGDVNNFKFNHKLHMLPGQWPANANPANAWTLDKIAEEYRANYRSEKDSPTGLVTLQCDSCHQAQQGDPSAQSGAYMLPIRYEQHCKACHPLEVFAPTAAGKAFDVPHGLGQDEVRKVLEGFSARVAGPNSAPAAAATPPSTFTPRVPIPGKTPGNNVAQNLFNPAQVKEWQTKLLNDNCLKCHANEVEEGNKSPDELAFETRVGFAPPKIRERWLKHGEFDHAAHRGWTLLKNGGEVAQATDDCKDCHAAAQATGVTGKPPLDDDQVLIPNVEHCAKCHAPVTTHPAFNAGARFDCAECHRYHAGAH